jgi:hypothetical protein
VKLTLAERRVEALEGENRVLKADRDFNMAMLEERQQVQVGGWVCGCGCGCVSVCGWTCVLAHADRCSLACLLLAMVSPTHNPPTQRPIPLTSPLVCRRPKRSRR